MNFKKSKKSYFAAFPGLLLFLAAAQAILLSTCAASAQDEPSAPSANVAIASEAYDYFSDVPDPPIEDETTVVYEEDNLPLRQVEISSVSTTKGKDSAAPDDPPDTEEYTTAVAYQSSEAENSGPASSTAPSDTDEKKETFPISLSAVISIGSIIAVIAAVSIAVVAVRSIKKKRKLSPKKERWDE